jgi:hypothetical protein
MAICLRPFLSIFTRPLKPASWPPNLPVSKNLYPGRSPGPSSRRCLASAILISVSPLSEKPATAWENRNEDGLKEAGESSSSESSRAKGIGWQKAEGVGEGEDVRDRSSKGEVGRDMFLRMAL